MIRREYNQNIFQIRLSEIISSILEDRRGYLTVAVTSKKEGKLLLRKTEGIKEWQKVLDEKVHTSKDRLDRKMPMTDQFWTRKQKSDPHDIHTWLLARDRTGGGSSRIPLYNFYHFSGQQLSYIVLSFTCEH